MLSEAQMKAVLERYIDAFCAGDADTLIELFADDATVEDPVGTATKLGKAAVSEFFRYATSVGASLKLVAPIRGSYGNAAAMAFDVTVPKPEGHDTYRVIDVMTFNGFGKIASMQAFWGREDRVAA